MMHKRGVILSSRVWASGTATSTRCQAETTSRIKIQETAAHVCKEMADRGRKESVMDLSKFMDSAVRVKFLGGREVSGILRGQDQLVNLVLDDAEEIVTDEEGKETIRRLGLCVCRGTQVLVIYPKDGVEEIENPFNR